MELERSCRVAALFGFDFCCPRIRGGDPSIRSFGEDCMDGISEFGGAILAVSVYGDPILGCPNACKGEQKQKGCSRFDLLQPFVFGGGA